MRRSADPRLPVQAVIWVEGGDQSCHKNTNKLLYHGLGEDVWAWLWVWCGRCCDTKTRRVCTIRLVATGRTSPSCVGGEVLLRGCAEHSFTSSVTQMRYFDGRKPLVQTGLSVTSHAAL